MSRAPLAVITKFYDEPDYLPVWLRHYAREIGPAHCYLLDHGSDDGSVRDLGGANVVHLPRSAQDNNEAVRLVRLFARSLLRRYRYVLYTDIDEMVLADPDRAATLADHAEDCRLPVVAMTGLQLVEVTRLEAPLDTSRPLLDQRRHVWFHASMCKPTLTSGPDSWSPGFHCMAQPAPFDDLCLFHLRYADRDIGLRRLHRSRNQAWSHPQAASHQRMRDEDWIARLDSFGSARAAEARPLAECAGELEACRAALTASRAGREGETYRIDLDITGDRLWTLPERFRGRI